MKRWIYDELAEWEPDGNSVWINADEADAEIRDLKKEIAENHTARRVEIAEIARLRKALEEIQECGHNDECLFCAMKDTLSLRALASKGEKK